jgi:NitT/TauT family transport system substrate-binding protein
MHRREFFKICGTSVLLANSFGRRSWAATQEQLKVRLVQAAPALSFASVYIANVRKFWQDEGLDVTSRLVKGGALGITALVNDETDFACVAAGDPLIAAEKGLPILSVAGIATSLTMSMAAHKDWMLSKGLTPQSPIKERVLALRGARIGVATVGGGPAQYGRYLLRSHGLDPEKDAVFLPVGQAGTRIAALREKQVDVFIGGAPDAEITEAEGYGALYISLAKDVPVFQDFVDIVVTTTNDFAEKNPEAVRRVARTIGRANNLLQSDPKAATSALKQAFPKVDPAVMDKAVANVRLAFRRDALMNESMWKNTVEVLHASGMLKSRPSVAEGVLWTNKFLK